MKALEDEPQLTLEACRGSEVAFEALVMHYEPRIRRMLYSLTQDAQLTQDLCQETFLAAVDSFYTSAGVWGRSFR